MLYILTCSINILYILRILLYFICDKYIILRILKMRSHYKRKKNIFKKVFCLFFIFLFWEGSMKFIFPPVVCKRNTPWILAFKHSIPSWVCCLGWWFILSRGSRSLSCTFWDFTVPLKFQFAHSSLDLHLKMPSLSSLLLPPSLSLADNLPTMVDFSFLGTMSQNKLLYNLLWSWCLSHSNREVMDIPSMNWKSLNMFMK